MKQQGFLIQWNKQQMDAKTTEAPASVMSLNSLRSLASLGSLGSLESLGSLGSLESLETAVCRQG